MPRRIAAFTPESLDVGYVPECDRSTEARFLDFDAEHPEVYEAFSKIAIGLYEQGFRSYSADVILHVIRYRHDRTSGPNGAKARVKINDRFTALYAEKFCLSDRKYRSFFHSRRKRRVV